MKTVNISQIICKTSVAIFSVTLISCMKPMSESVMDKTAGLNGSFERTENNLPLNWLLYTQKVAGGDFNISIDTKEFKDGKQSLKIDVKECSDKGGHLSPGLAQEIPVQENEIYKISFWIKNSNSAYTIKINAVDEFNADKGYTENGTQNSDDWKKLEYTYVIPAKMKHLRLEISVLKPGTFWVDDVKIEKLN